MEGGRVILVVAMLIATLGPINCKPLSPSKVPSVQQASIVSRRQINYGDDYPASRQFVPGIGEFILDLILNTFGVGLPQGVANGPIGSVQQNQMDKTLSDILASELEKEYQNYISTQIPPYQQRTRQQDSQAEASFFSSNNWEIARECVNDILGPEDGMSIQENQALISEVRDVWMGRTDLNHARAQIRLNWEVIRGCVDRYFNSRDDSSNAQVEFLSYFWQSCTDQVYVMAFTGGSTNALTTDPPSVELRVGNEVRSVTLPTVTGLEYQRNKGDIWAINMAEFGFTDTCIRQGDIDGIAIVEGGTDGWLIDSIVIILQDEDGLFSLLSSEIGVNTWIDGNGGQERRRLDLNLN